MNEMTRRKLEMGKRALEFCRAHPDSSPEYVAAVARLEALLARAEELQMQEQTERKPPHIPLKRSGPHGKVIPFETRLKSDPTDPAA
jgi:hypothetical protein